MIFDKGSEECKRGREKTGKDTHSKAGKYFRKYMVTKLNDDEEFEINQEYINKSGIEFVDLPVEAEPEEPKKQEEKQPLLKRIGKRLLPIPRLTTIVVPFFSYNPASYSGNRP